MFLLRYHRISPTATVVKAKDVMESYEPRRYGSARIIISSTARAFFSLFSEAPEQKASLKFRLDQLL